MKFDLETLAKESAKLAKEFNRVFNVKGKAIRQLDDRFHEQHELVFTQINCIDCANCCKTLGPRITAKDLQVLGLHLKMKPSKLFDKYFRVDEDNDIVFKEMPCPFLLQDNYCSVYEYRPKACREYPHTNSSRMIQLHKLTIKNAAICPAVFEILNRLRISKLEK